MARQYAHDVAIAGNLLALFAVVGNWKEIRELSSTILYFLHGSRIQLHTRKGLS
jgi:hypothetical protein